MIWKASDDFTCSILPVVEFILDHYYITIL